MKEGRLQHVKNTCQTKNTPGRPGSPIETRRGIRVSFRLIEYSRLRQLAARTPRVHLLERDVWGRLHLLRLDKIIRISTVKKQGEG